MIFQVAPKINAHNSFMLGDLGKRFGSLLLLAGKCSALTCSQNPFASVHVVSSLELHVSQLYSRQKLMIIKGFTSMFL